MLLFLNQTIQKTKGINMWRIASILIIVCTLVACDKNQIFDQYQSTKNGWHRDTLVQFSWKQESAEPVNLFIQLRNNEKYAFNNLFVIAKLKFPNQKVLVDTLEYTMANPDGKFIDQGFSSIVTNQLYYKEKLTLEKGDYTITLEQANRKNGSVKPLEVLDGVTDVGFRVEKVDLKK